MMLLLLLLMETIVVQSGALSGTSQCSHTETRNQYLHFAANKDFVICCQLDERFCNTTFVNTTLTLLPDNKNMCPDSCIKERMYRQGTCFVMFEVNKASSVDEGDYMCTFEGVNMFKYIVRIIEKPKLPVITFFSCTQKNTLTVTFDRGIINTAYNDSYHVTLTDSNSKKVTTLCDTTYGTCKPGKRICSCIYSNSLDTIPDPRKKVIITVIVLRSVESSESSKNYTIRGVIQPGPVQMLRVKNISPYEAYVYFCMDHQTFRLYAFMSSEVPLQFHLWLYRTQGVPEILNVTIPSTADLMSYTLYMCMRVLLSNLTAFTDYTVVVSNSGGGGQSQKTKFEFVTNQTVPAQPPETDTFSFSRPDSLNVSGTLMPGLILMWKPLPYAAIGGTNLSYYIEVSSENGFSVNKTVLETYAVVSQENLPLGPLTAKIWAQNGIGRSQNYTALDIPSKSDSTPQYVIVDLNGDDMAVYVSMKQLEKDSQLAIQWCNNYTDSKVYGLRVCQEYPQIDVHTIKAADGEVQKFNIRSSKADDHSEVLYNRTVHFSDLQFLNSVPDINKTAVAVVVMYPATAIQAMEDYDFPENEIDEDDDFYDNVNDLYRRKRDDDISQQATTKVFTSLKTEKSLWLSGMIPVNCYYDRTKDEVSLVVRFDQSDETVTLRWNQACDTDTPSQFLANSFQVFTSTDEHCNKDRVFLQTISAKVFQSNFVKLPEKTQFACIQACKDDWECTSEIHVTAVKFSTGTSTISSYVPIAIVLPILFLVFIIMGIMCCCCWRNRGKHITKEFGQKQFQLPNATSEAPSSPPLDLNTRRVAPDGSGRTKEHSVSIGSADSGRGTGVCEVDSSRQNKRDSDVSSDMQSADSFKNNWSQCATTDETLPIDSSASRSLINVTNNGDNTSRSTRLEMEEINETCDRNESDEENEEDIGECEVEQNQQQALEELGFDFQTNDSGSMQSLGSNETFPSINTSNAVSDLNGNTTDHIRNSMPSVSPPRYKVPSSDDSSFHRLLSSESESDGDSAQASFKFDNSIC